MPYATLAGVAQSNFSVDSISGNNHATDIVIGHERSIIDTFSEHSRPIVV